MIDRKQPSNDVIKCFVDAAILCKEKKFGHYLGHLCDVSNLADALKEIAKCEKDINPKIQKIFCDFLPTFYVRHIVTEELGDDKLGDDVLLDAFKKLLPKYHGVGLMLYRGETYERFIKGTYGWSWTTEYVPGTIVGASSYASNIAKDESKKSVVLKVYVPQEFIMCDLCHKKMLLTDEPEFIVDYRSLRIKPEVIETFYPKS